MEWEPDQGTLEVDGTHLHIATETRVETYRFMRDAIHGHYPNARISLRKETHVVRKALALCNADRNCLL